MARAGREDLERYVLSPDPGSRVDLAILRGLAVEWASEHFPDYQVAIVYHDDNEGRIPHAHVVVNNTSLETGSGSRSPTPSSSTAPSSSSRRSAALLLKLLNFSCSRCSFPSDHSDHFLVNINTIVAQTKTHAGPRRRIARKDWRSHGARYEMRGTREQPGPR